MTEIPMTTNEIVAALVSIPVTVALAALLNSVLKVASRFKPVTAMVVAIALSEFAAYILAGDWRVALARGVLIGLLASGFYSQTKTLARD